MKKLTKLVAAMALLAGILMLTGCGLNIKKTYNHWYKYEGDQTLDIPLGNIGSSDDESDSSKTGAIKNAEFYVYYSQSEGLTVAVQTKSTENIEIAGGLKTVQTTITTGGTKKYPDFEASKWAALMLLGSFEQCSAPKIVADPESCVNITDIIDGEIQWKKVLKKILINKLLGDD